MSTNFIILICPYCMEKAAKFKHTNDTTYIICDDCYAKLQNNKGKKD